MALSVAMAEATVSGAVGPVLVPLARTPLKLIRRQRVRLICPHCQGRMAEGKACRKACERGKKCAGKKRKKLSESVGDLVKVGGKIGWVFWSKGNRIGVVTKDGIKWSSARSADYLMDQGSFHVKLHGYNYWHSVLDDWLDDARDTGKLSAWEEKFLSSLQGKLRGYYNPSTKQMGIVVRILRNAFGEPYKGKKKPVSEATAPKKLKHGTKVRVKHPSGVTPEMDATAWRDLRAKGPDNRNYRGMELVKIIEDVRPVPDCKPVVPPDPDCTLTGGWNKAMRRKGLKLLKRTKKRSSAK